MISRIKGSLISKNIPIIEIFCSGLTYEILVSMETFNKLPEVSSDVDIFVYLLIKEDSHTLYGFFTTMERAVFQQLISVSGIGASTARTMLSSLEPQQIQRAIIGEDLALIKSVKGIGLKTAQRVLIELKDKMINLFEGEEIEAFSNNTIKEEALSALEVLGYSRKQSEKVIDNVIQSNPEYSVEALIKAALNKL